MIHKCSTNRRRGTTAVEAAIVFPLTFLLLLGLAVGSLGVFRYQEVAALAREGARYASTHGAQYRKDAGWGTGTAGTSTGGTSNGFLWYQADPSLAPGTNSSWCQNIYDSAIGSKRVALSPNMLTCQVGWPPIINLPNPDNWPGSRVSVTVTYQWMPEAFLIGPINLSSTSTMPITN